MPKTIKASPTPEKDRPTENEIRELAYRFYVDRGNEPGHELEDWLRAEAALTQTRSKAEAA